MSQLIDSETCPKCGSKVELGYGLAFGGFGVYQYCDNLECDWHVKDRECPVCEGVDSHAANCAEKAQ